MICSTGGPAATINASAPLMTQDIAAQILLALIPLFLLAAGQALVMIGGGMDLSVPAMIAVCVATGARVTAATASVLAGVTAMLVTGALMGFCNGLGVARLRLAPPVLTLATFGLFSGLALSLPSDQTGAVVPLEMQSIGSNLPAWAGLAVLSGIALHLVLERMVLGRWLRAVGFHRESAVIAGVPVARVTLGSYVLSGFCTALAAVFFAAQPSATAPGPGPGLIFLMVDILGALAIGGVGFSGGRGRLSGVLAGAATMAMLGVILIHAGLPPGPILMIKAAVWLAAAVLRQGNRS